MSAQQGPPDRRHPDDLPSPRLSRPRRLHLRRRPCRVKRFAAVEKTEAGSEIAFATAREVEAEAKKKVYVHGSRGTSVRRDIEPRTGRGR